MARLWTIRSESLLLGAEGKVAHKSRDHPISIREVTTHVCEVTQSLLRSGRYNSFCKESGIGVIDRSGFVSCDERTDE